MAEITIRVELEDIAGADKSARNSPAARAIRRRLKLRLGDVEVTHGRVQIGQKVYPLPAEVDHAERMHNTNGTIPPYRFKLSNQPLPCFFYDNPKLQAIYEQAQRGL